MLELSRNCIFLKDLSNNMKNIENIESYKEVLGEILKNKNRFYTYNFNE